MKRDRKKLLDRVKLYFDGLEEGQSETAEGLTLKLIDEGWLEKGLRLKVSILLRQILVEASWLLRVRRGEYRLVDVCKDESPHRLDG